MERAPSVLAFYSSHVLCVGKCETVLCLSVDESQDASSVVGRRGRCVLWCLRVYPSLH